jgi:hypothetical protein
MADEELREAAARFDGESVEFLQRCFGVPTRERHRIEALRAASRIVAEHPGNQRNPKMAIDDTLYFAEAFAKWLEAGER